MNAPKAKGTKGENEAVDILVEAGFPRADPADPNSVGVKRFQGGWESHDIEFANMPHMDWVIEAKFRKAWHLFGWIRKIRRRALTPAHTVHTDYMKRVGMPPVEVPAGAHDNWAIFAIHGDRRTIEGREVGAVCIMDARRAAELIYFYEMHP
jgi:hypothetical protein